MDIAAYLKDRNVAFEVLRHEPTFEAQQMAHAVHVPGKQVAKTVLLQVNHGFSYVVAVLPATRKVDLAAMSHALGDCDVRLATEVEMSRLCPDCEVGALLPFGSKYGAKTLVDEQLAQSESIVFEGNRHDESIRMRFDDFNELEHPLILSYSAASA